MLARWINKVLNPRYGRYTPLNRSK
ncbi:hypothetical protein NPIL_110881, partial [Nephila pilipes]